ncbi:hypothetical protein FHS37_005960 [Streptomyces griseostramineus]|uniref:Transposase IS204/IS1001/IS1096/IS1165 zinc-finger domain-containing protein n=1 Tax=Streptomyces griseomycini TaxID=66895 RepID=A0A7W7PV89_9ACTN|nr:hypothetical protein [Streptomyces griseomycini]GGR40872.1 hypothetical protein GCM10015536_53240 [Streptomyces griseomycini]
MEETALRLKELLFPSIADVAVLSADVSDEAVRIEARVTTIGPECPGCGSWSNRVHGSCPRSPADVPAAGRRVVVCLHVRRFLCPDASCGRLTFVEQVPGLIRPHGRRSKRLRRAPAAVGLALAGRAGARTARVFGVPVSRSTVLRLVAERQGERLPRWLDAVVTGLTLSWSSGVVGGRVNRIEMPKRRMLGRAGFDRLRKRVLLHTEGSVPESPEAPADEAQGAMCRTSSRDFCRGAAVHSSARGSEAASRRWLPACLAACRLASMFAVSAKAGTVATNPSHRVATTACLVLLCQASRASANAADAMGSI